MYEDAFNKAQISSQREKKLSDWTESSCVGCSSCVQSVCSSFSFYFGFKACFAENSFIIEPESTPSDYTEPKL